MLTTNGDGSRSTDSVRPMDFRISRVDNIHALRFGQRRSLGAGNESDGHNVMRRACAAIRTRLDGFLQVWKKRKSAFVIPDFKPARRHSATMSMNSSAVSSIGAPTSWASSFAFERASSLASTRRRSAAATFSKYIASAFCRAVAFDLDVFHSGITCSPLRPYVYIVASRAEALPCPSTLAMWCFGRPPVFGLRRLPL